MHPISYAPSFLRSLYGLGKRNLSPAYLREPVYAIGGFHGIDVARHVERPRPLAGRYVGQRYEPDAVTVREGRRNRQRAELDGKARSFLLAHMPTPGMVKEK